MRKVVWENITVYNFSENRQNALEGSRFFITFYYLDWIDRIIS